MIKCSRSRISHHLHHTFSFPDENTSLWPYSLVPFVFAVNFQNCANMFYNVYLVIYLNIFCQRSAVRLAFQGRSSELRRFLPFPHMFIMFRCDEEQTPFAVLDSHIFRNLSWTNLNVCQMCKCMQCCVQWTGNDLPIKKKENLKILKKSWIMDTFICCDIWRVNLVSCFKNLSY